MLPPDLQPHFDAIANAYGLDQPLHKPDPRGALQLASDLESVAVHCATTGRRFSLFVVSASDVEAAMGLVKIVQWAKKQKTGK